MSDLIRWGCRVITFSLTLIWAPTARAFVTDVDEDLGIWPNGTITYQVRLGGTASGTLLDGATSWTTVVESAMAEWNQHMQNIQFAAQEAAVGGGVDENEVNDLFFAETHYGDAFGESTLAITESRWGGFSRPLPRIEADIVFNSKSSLNWNSYRGARRNDVDDLRRVLIHELGHALGLRHPDQNGQNLSAIMNAFVSDIDTAVTDDINGAQSLYGVGASGPGGGSGGSSGDSYETDDTAGAATTITNGATQTHSIHVVGDKDWVTFTLPANATNLRIETDGASGDTEIFLFGPNSSTNQITSNNDSGNGAFSLITRSSPEQGTYFVRVEEFSNNSTISAYTIQVSWTESSGGSGELSADSFESNNTAETASTITNGESQSHTIHVVGDRDWSTFTLPSGATDLRIETSGPDGNSDTKIFLFGPNSSTTLLTEDDDGGTGFFSLITLANPNAGTYHLRVDEFNNNGTIAAYTLSVSWTAPVSSSSSAKLSNLSVRAKTGGQFGTLILGFATSTASKEMLVRGIGPSLGFYGITDAIDDPQMEMFRMNEDGSATGIDSNGDWATSHNADSIVTTGASLGAFPTDNDREAILLRSVPPSPYTIQVNDVAAGIGQVLIEAYDADALSAVGRLTNLSTRTEVGGAAGILTAGFVVAGTGNMTVLIRGVGPTLAGFGVSGAIADPRFQVLNADQQTVGSNDNWNSSGAAAKRSAAAQVGAFALLEGSLDAALLISLSPGAYTVLMDGVSGSSGNGLIEIYEVR